MPWQKQLKRGKRYARVFVYLSLSPTLCRSTEPVLAAFSVLDMQRYDVILIIYLSMVSICPSIYLSIIPVCMYTWEHTQQFGEISGGGGKRLGGEVSQSVNQSAYQSIIQSVRQSISRSVSLSVGQANPINPVIALFFLFYAGVGDVLMEEDDADKDDDTCLVLSIQANHDTDTFSHCSSCFLCMGIYSSIYRSIDLFYYLC